MASGQKPKLPGVLTPQRKIELYSGTYFAACTLGGIIGNPVAFPRLRQLPLRTDTLMYCSMRSYPHARHTSRRSQNPSPSRSQALHLKLCRMAANIHEGRNPWHLLWMVSDLRGILLPRCGQIWLLRSVQALVR